MKRLQQKARGVSWSPWAARADVWRSYAVELNDGDSEQGDRLGAGQVGYSKGQADCKTKDAGKDGVSEARGVARHGEGQADSPRTTGEATPGIGDRKTSIRTEASHTTTTKSESVPVCPATLPSVNSTTLPSVDKILKLYECRD